MTRCPSQDWDVYSRNQDAPEITVLRNTVQKARKEYKCIMCSKPISIGTRYERIVYIDDEGKLKSDPAHTLSAACAYYEDE